LLISIVKALSYNNYMEIGSQEIARVTGKPSTVRIEMKQTIPTQSSESVNSYTKIKVVRNEKEREAGLFVHKQFMDHESMASFLNNNTILKESGFPVPPTVREIVGKNELLITDLTEGGKHIVFSVNEIQDNAVDIPFRISNLSQVEDEILRLGKKADEKGFVILEDAYFIVVDKQTKLARVVLGDLGPQGFYSSVEDFYKTFPLLTGATSQSVERAKILIDTDLRFLHESKAS